MPLKICSYNCRGYNNSKSAYINQLLSQVDMLCLQEHWLSDSQLSVLGSVNLDYAVCGVSGFDNSEILRGRPYGGCAIMWRQDLCAQVEVIAADSKRVCAVRIVSSHWRLVIICAYMPYEDGELSTDIYVDQLACIEHLVHSNADCQVVICGDFNVDFTRQRLHTILLSSFCENLDMFPAHGHYSYDIDYTYCFGTIRYSTLDHFLLSGTLYETCVDSVTVVHNIDNFSDHHPIFMYLSLDTKYVGITNKAHFPRLSWVKASETDLNQYRDVLGENLTHIILPIEALTCCNM